MLRGSEPTHIEKPGYSGHTGYILMNGWRIIAVPVATAVTVPSRSFSKPCTRHSAQWTGGPQSRTSQVDQVKSRRAAEMHGGAGHIGNRLRQPLARRHPAFASGTALRRLRTFAGRARTDGVGRSDHSQTLADRPDRQPVVARDDNGMIRSERSVPDEVRI
jgi:hypothetical protein